MKIVKLLIKIAIIFVAIAILLAVAINLYIYNYSNKYIITKDEATSLVGVDCIVVLGAGVRNGEPSTVLAERLDTGAELFEAGVSKLFLLTGDNGSNYYNEVAAMRNYYLNHYEGVIDTSNIYLDYAGFSTYDSMYRLKAVFGAKDPVLVTQKFHLYRTVFAARQLGIKAYGVASEGEYDLRMSDEAREFLARIKTFFLLTSKALPKYLGEKVPLIYPSPGN